MKTTPYRSAHPADRQARKEDLVDFLVWCGNPVSPELLMRLTVGQLRSNARIYMATGNYTRKQGP